MRIGKLLLAVAIFVMAAALSACSSEQAQEPVAPKAPSQQQAQDGGPADKTLTGTGPKMQRVKDAPMPDSPGDDAEGLKNYA